MTDPNEPTRFSITDMFNSDDSDTSDEYDDYDESDTTYDGYDAYDDGGDDNDGRYRAAGGGFGAGAISALIAGGLVVIGLSWWGGRATASGGSTEHTVTQTGSLVTQEVTVTQNRTVTSTAPAPPARVVTQTVVVRPPAKTVTVKAPATTVTASAPAGGTTTVTAPATTVTKPGPATTVTVTKTVAGPPGQNK